MYARPANRAAHNDLWVLIRDGLRARGLTAPDDLDHDINYMDGWARDDLVLSQICNLPYRTRFKDRVTLIGAAHYDLPDCAPGYYNSVFVTRPGGPKTPAACAGAQFVCNDLLSQSGYGAPQLWAQAHGFTFDAPRITGSHLASIAAVADGHADFAAIDAQTWWIACQETPQAKGLHVIGTTDPSPGQTFVTRAGQDPAPYFAAISDAIAALPKATRQTLNLRGIVSLPAKAYDLPLPHAHP